MSVGPPLRAGERVLVRLPAWLGDVVMVEPALRALEEALGAGALTLVGRGAHLELLDGRFSGARRIALGQGERERARDWRGHDAALLLTGSWRGALAAWRAGIPRRIGFARGGRGALLTDSLAPPLERGGVPLGLGRAGRGRRWLPRPLGRGVAELLALAGVTVRDPRPRIDVREEWLAAARARRAALGLDPLAPFALASVGARDGSAKGWPGESWALALAQLELGSRLALVLACGPGEERALEVARALLPDAHALVAPPAGLAELAAHCAEARVVLCADSGARHVARAVGAAVACVAGPSDPRHTAGGGERETLARVVVPCGPCHLERCPLAGDARHRCMLAIDPVRVARDALALSGTIPG